MGFGAWFVRLLTKSSRFHLHQEPASTAGELIELIDRFSEGCLSYPLEWDDFISWEQDNPSVEAVRSAIGEHELWLFSGGKAERNAYVYRVIEERNRLAGLLGRPERPLPILTAEEEALLAESASIPPGSSAP